MMRSISQLTVILIFAVLVSDAYSQDITEMIRRWIELITVPLRLILGLCFALTAFKWFKSDEEGRKATQAAFIGILVFFIGFEIVNWLMP